MEREIRVLNVDDSSEFADLTATYLERVDDRFAVETAASGGAGLDRFCSGDFDCVVSDHEMPGRNGIELLEAVREASPSVPFLLFTGKGSEEVASAPISAAVTDYIQKEGGTEQLTVLANRISNAVEQRRAREDAERTERRLSELPENTPDVLWMFSADWSNSCSSTPRTRTCTAVRVPISRPTPARLSTQSTPRTATSCGRRWRPSPAVRRWKSSTASTPVTTSGAPSGCTAN